MHRGNHQTAVAGPLSQLTDKHGQMTLTGDRLEEEVAPHAQGVDVALAAFDVGKGSAKTPEEEVRKIEIAYPQAVDGSASAPTESPVAEGLPGHASAGFTLREKQE